MNCGPCVDFGFESKADPVSHGLGTLAFIQIGHFYRLKGFDPLDSFNYVLESHDLNVVRMFYQRVLVMDSGKIVEQGAVDDVIRNPQHPFTQQLIAAIPGWPYSKYGSKSFLGKAIDRYTKRHRTPSF
mgnify:FL=1